ncbi:hypothetical protein RND71_024510 [Anisodus tanguticus]|uniref:Uncharacterized protein n=1 Tax=Anisodus tanguticus TaxID=243964 RepID=A0AAE1VBR8_9SOLA|nr:hypothetical protein RND71_024510 [Anisodus tanguticus]
MAGVGIDGIHYVPVPSPQWINDQQTPQYYVEYLAEKMWSLRFNWKLRQNLLISD